MNKTILFLIFAIHLPLHAMFYDDQKPPCDDKDLSVEMQCHILNFATTCAKNSKEAARIINVLSLTTQQLYLEVNSPKYSDNLIKKLATKYYCSHETIAKRLRSKQAKERLALQYELKNLCCSPYTLNQCEQLDILISRGIDFEFTYNHCHLQKTPLMLTMNYNNGMFQRLLDYGANINGCNSHGTTALHLACKTLPMSDIVRLINHPNIAINQPNNAGDNALLYCCNHHRLTKRLFKLCKRLLEAGSDPECTNKRGINPLYVLTILNQLPNNHRLVILFNDAIEQKHAPNALNH
jgi:Ankyrin repeats (3 copies)